MPCEIFAFKQRENIQSEFYPERRVFCGKNNFSLYSAETAVKESLLC